MSEYTAPLRDIEFLLNHVADSRFFNQQPAFIDYDPSLVSAVLAEAGKFASQVLAPLNHSGDIEGCHFHAGVVRTPQGWCEAYRQFCDNGWLSLALPEDNGGQGLPRFIAGAVHEMWLSANMSFVMFQTLTQGAVEILHAFASDELKKLYLDKLVSGQWATCMSLTEPSAGSDLGSIRTLATKLTSELDDGRYLLKGQKIFISYGEHDLAENIAHLVLARTPDAPIGAKGLSLFVVSKYQLDESGNLAALNDLQCVSIEHKTGLHGSPTCSINYGEERGAIGHLIGAEHCGLQYMFVLMNEARLSTGQQGVAIAEAGFQRALRYATERVQGRDLISGAANVTIAQHPDVKRMLMSMHSQVFALRALSFQIAARLDLAQQGGEHSAAERRFIALMTPVFKAFATESGNHMAGTAVQVFGGMGVIEETGIAQLMRDVRVTTIYEGSTGIQANDLMLRKVVADNGFAINELIADIEADYTIFSVSSATVIETACNRAMLDSLKDSVCYLLSATKTEQLCAADSFLQLVGFSCTSWMMMRAYVAAINANSTDTAHLGNIKALCQFYFAHHTPKIQSLYHTVVNAQSGIGDYQLSR